MGISLSPLNGLALHPFLNHWNPWSIKTLENYETLEPLQPLTPDVLEPLKFLTIDVLDLQSHEPRREPLNPFYP